MNSFSAIIDAFGGPAKYAAAIGIPDSHARTIKARDSIPPEHWPATITAAAKRGIAGVTWESLARLAAALAARRRPVVEAPGAGVPS